MSRSDLYDQIAAAWPESVPPLTAAEALRAAPRLYRVAMGHAFAGALVATTGSSWSQLRGSELRINVSRGWVGFVHSLSRSFYAALHPEEAPQGKDQARFELRLVREVVARGWLDGRLRDKPHGISTPGSKADKQLDSLAQIDEDIAELDRKAMTIEARLTTLHRRRRRLLHAIEKAEKLQPRRMLTLELEQRPVYPRARAVDFELEPEPELPAGALQ